MTIAAAFGVVVSNQPSSTKPHQCVNIVCVNLIDVTFFERVLSGNYCDHLSFQFFTLLHFLPTTKTRRVTLITCEAHMAHHPKLIIKAGWFAC